MTLQDIKKKKMLRTDGHARTDNVKTVYPPQTKFAGGIMKVVENLFFKKKAYGEKRFIEKSYVVGTHWNCLIEAIPMCTYNI